MDARQRAHEKMKKMSIKSKQDSVETNSMEDGGKTTDFPINNFPTQCEKIENISVSLYFM